MSIYGPCDGVASQEASGDLKESKKYIDSRVQQLLPRAGGTVSGAISLDRRGVSISRGGNLSVNTVGGGPEVDIRQGANNTENSLPGGIRLRDRNDRALYQVGWSDDGNLGVYHVERGDPQIQVVGEFSPTHLTSLAMPVKPQDAATKAYVDNRKPVITIWAEERGRLDSGQYEWSFGGGSEGRAHSKCGYPLPSSGRLKWLGLASTNNSGQSIGQLSVSVVVDGRVTHQSITKPAAQVSHHTRVNHPLELRAGSVINFVTRTTRTDARSSIVSAIIELDL